MSVFVLLGGGVLLVAAAVYFMRADRSAMNVIRRAREQRAQRALAGLTLSELTMRAQAGDGAAQYRLGLSYATGSGVAVDFSRANYWWERAIQSNVTDAFYCLAVNYERGRGTAVVSVKAVRLYERAAQAGNSDAQCNLGLMFLHGAGVTKSVVRAIRWLVASVAQGNEQAAENLEWLVNQHHVIDSHERAEIEEIERLAHRNDADALLVLGWMYAHGVMLPKDLAIARVHYNRAQARGHIFAHVLLSKLPDADKVNVRPV